MIKPSDLKNPNAVDPKHEAHCVQLEKVFDNAITRADDSGEWPAKVPRYRNRIPESALNAVIAKYKAAGWRVTRPATGTALVTIEPARTAPKPIDL